MSYDPSKCYSNNQLIKHFKDRIASLNDQLIDLSIQNISYDQQIKLRIIKSNINANLAMLEHTEKVNRTGRKSPLIA